MKCRCGQLELPLEAVSPIWVPAATHCPFLTVMLVPREVAVDGLLVAAVVEDDVVVEVGDGRAPVEVAAHALLDAEHAAVERREDGHADPDLAKAPDDRVDPGMPVVGLAAAGVVAHPRAVVEVDEVGDVEVLANRSRVRIKEEQPGGRLGGDGRGSSERPEAGECCNGLFHFRPLHYGRG